MLKCGKSLTSGGGLRYNKGMAGKQRKNSKVPDHLREHCFKPGESGNPSGRPKGAGWSITLRKLGKRRVPQTPWAQKAIKSVGLDPEEATVEEVLLALGYYHAARGNVGFFRELFDRMEGPVPKKQEITGRDGGPVEVRSLADLILGENGQDANDESQTED